LRERRRRRDKAEKNDGDRYCKAGHNQTLVVSKISQRSADEARPARSTQESLQGRSSATLATMHRQDLREYDRYHKRNAAGYNRKSPFCADLAGFASMAIGG
jgi:hypothetical protein